MDGGELFSRIEESQGFSERGENSKLKDINTKFNKSIIKLKHQMTDQTLKSQRANPNAQFHLPIIRSPLDIIKVPRLEDLTSNGSSITVSLLQTLQK